MSIAVDARAALEKAGITTRVVSMPCREWFERQTKAYHDRVLPPSIRARVSVEAAVGLGWRDFVGDAGRIICLEHFGASADYKRPSTASSGSPPRRRSRRPRTRSRPPNAAATVAPVQDVNPRSTQNGSLTDTTPATPAAKKATVAAR